MKIDTSSWKPFKLGGEDGLFKIIKGTRLTKQQMVPGEINYIGATAFNNGITGKIGNTDSIHQPPCLTVAYNGSLGETFYQQSPFWATDDCNILQPKFNLTENVAFFLIPLIKNEGKKYAYNDKWKLEEMEKAILLLPSTPDEKPDWLYMERYISELRIKAQLSVNQLVKLGGVNHAQ